MEIIPSIDLKSGRCVRLYQGDYNRETVYSNDPVAVAMGWQRQGGARLHLVDLDGAAAGQQANLEVIRAIVSGLDMPVQVGGGVRDLATARGLLEMGADRVVLGTVAVQDPELVRRLCDQKGAEVVVVAVDARDGMVAVKGWTEATSVRALELVQRMEELGVRRFLYTDISRDGTLTQPNLEAVEEMVKATSSAVLASGGISSEAHLARLAAIGVEGAILGSALYTGALSLGAAIRAVTPAGKRK